MLEVRGGIMKILLLAAVVLLAASTAVQAKAKLPQVMLGDWCIDRETGKEYWRTPRDDCEQRSLTVRRQSYISQPDSECKSKKLEQKDTSVFRISAFCV